MKKINNYIQEKLIITKDSKLKTSLDTSFATAKFNSIKELSKWKPSEFDDSIVSFISSSITKRPFYVWELEIGSDEHSKFQNMYFKHLKDIKFDELPPNKINTRSFLNKEGTGAYINVYTKNNNEKYIMINIIEAHSRNIITILQE